MPKANFVFHLWPPESLSSARMMTLNPPAHCLVRPVWVKQSCTFMRSHLGFIIRSGWWNTHRCLKNAIWNLGFKFVLNGLQLQEVGWNELIIWTRCACSCPCSCASGNDEGPLPGRKNPAAHGEEQQEGGEWGSIGDAQTRSDMWTNTIDSNGIRKITQERKACWGMIAQTYWRWSGLRVGCYVNRRTLLERSLKPQKLTAASVLFSRWKVCVVHSPWCLKSSR